MSVWLENRAFGKYNRYHIYIICNETKDDLNFAIAFEEE